MRKVLLFLTLSFAAMAQTTNCVTLTGDPTTPMIVNHCGKQIVAAMVVFTPSAGNPDPAVMQCLFTTTPNELPDGGSTKVGRYATNFTASAAKVTAVIFADGELRGAEDNNFQKNCGTTFPVHAPGVANG